VRVKFWQVTQCFKQRVTWMVINNMTCVEIPTVITAFSWMKRLAFIQETCIKLLWIVPQQSVIHTLSSWNDLVQYRHDCAFTTAFNSLKPQKGFIYVSLSQTHIVQPINSATFKNCSTAAIWMVNGTAVMTNTTIDTRCDSGNYR